MDFSSLVEHTFVGASVINLLLVYFRRDFYEREDQYRRVAATGSARYSWPETWTVIVNLRRTSTPATELSTFSGSRRTACFFVADFFGALGTAFFEFLRIVFLGAAFWGPPCSPSLLHALLHLLYEWGVLPNVTLVLKLLRQQFAI